MHNLLRWLGPDRLVAICFAIVCIVILVLALAVAHFDHCLESKITGYTASAVLVGKTPVVTLVPVYTCVRAGE